MNGSVLYQFSFPVRVSREDAFRSIFLLKPNADGIQQGKASYFLPSHVIVVFTVSFTQSISTPLVILFEVSPGYAQKSYLPTA